MNNLTHTYLIRTVFTVILAVGIALAYPVNVIVDHSGLVDSHFHLSDDDDHSSDSTFEDQLCAYCLSLNSMDVSEEQTLVGKEIKEINYAPNSAIPLKIAIIRRPARSPPISFDYSSKIQTRKHQKDLL